MFHSELERERYDIHKVYPPAYRFKCLQISFHEAFRSNNLEKKIALRGYPRFFMVNAKEKCLACEISLSDLIDMKAHNDYRVGVLKP